MVIAEVACGAFGYLWDSRRLDMGLELGRIMLTVVRKYSRFSSPILGLVGCFFSFSFVQSAQAVPLSEADINRGSSFSLGDLAAKSYDGPLFNYFATASSASNSNVLRFGAFTGLPGGSNLEVFLLAEAAGYAGTIPGFANQFGVVVNGVFNPIINSASANPGASATKFQAENESFTFALLSPEGLFTSDDAANSDKAPHLVALEVIKDTTITINRPSLNSSSPITYDLRAGDFVLFWEDLKASGNSALGGIPNISDFDYNDMVLVVRQSAIPEPATVGLLGAGLLGLLRRRRTS